MDQDISQFLHVQPIDSEPFSDKRESLKSRIFRILTRSKFRSAALSQTTIDFVKSHIATQIKAGEPIIIVYAMGGGRGIGTNNFPKADWGEYLHLKFLTENLSPVGEIYRPGVEVRWSLDDYAARIFNNYLPEWQEEYTKGLDILLEHFAQISNGKVKHRRIPTDTWYKDFNALKAKLLADAKLRAATPEAASIIADWSKRAENNFYNVNNLEGEELKQAIEFSAIINMVWLDYDFEVRTDFFTSGAMIAHFPAFPDCFYIQTVPGSNTQFWKASGYLEYKDGAYKSRLATREAWKNIEEKLSFVNNPLGVPLDFLGKLPVLRY